MMVFYKVNLNSPESAQIDSASVRLTGNMLQNWFCWRDKNAGLRRSMRRMRRSNLPDVIVNAGIPSGVHVHARNKQTNVPAEPGRRSADIP